MKHVDMVLVFKVDICAEFYEVLYYLDVAVERCEK